MMIETILYVYGFVVFGKFTKLCAYPPTVFMLQVFIQLGPMARARHDMTILDDHWNILCLLFPLFPHLFITLNLLNTFELVFQCFEKKYVVKSAFLKYWDQSYIFYK